MPAQGRQELRLLWYHAGWLSQALGRGDFASAGRLARVMLGRVREDGLLLLGNRRKVLCEVCEWRGNRFYPYTDQGLGFWPHEICPRCASLSRHRLQVRYLRERLGIDRKHLKILEIGPWGMRRIFSRFPHVEYVAADIKPIPGCVCADATMLPFPCGTFDVVVCFNVLYGVREDRLAVSEMCRVCCDGGVVLLSEPVGHLPSGAPWHNTEEFVHVQADKHGALRWYGLDIVARLAQPQCFFQVDRYAFNLSARSLRKYGLSPRLLFVAEKRPDDPSATEHRTGDSAHSIQSAEHSILGAS